ACNRNSTRSFERGHDGNILEEAYRGRYARQRLLNFWPESSCGYHAIKRFVCIIQVTSAPLNIAEGCGAASNTEFSRFLGFAYRSLKEVVTALELCERLYPSLPRDRTQSLIEEGNQSDFQDDFRSDAEGRSWKSRPVSVRLRTQNSRLKTPRPGVQTNLQ